MWNQLPKTPLPNFYRDPGVIDALSCDGQIYVRCPGCAWERRLPPVSSAAEIAKYARCPRCKEERSALTRHLLSVEVACEDCSAHTRAEWNTLLGSSCVNCDSKRLRVIPVRVTPPFPPTCGEEMAPDVTWGVSVKEDFELIQAEAAGGRASPQFLLHFAMLARFVHRLATSNAYSDKDDAASALNIEANMWREYFKDSGDRDAGLWALMLFEESAKRTGHPLGRALVEHNLAMAVYTLLTRYPEEVLAIITDRPGFRRFGLDAAERALAAFAEERSEMGEIQRALIQYLIGDLHKVQRSDPEALHRAIAHYDRALSCEGLPPQRRLAILEARGSATARMVSADPREVERVIENLEALAGQLEGAAPFTALIPTHLTLGQLYMVAGRPKDAARRLEPPAALALEELDATADEASLRHKARQVSDLFDYLALAYAARGRFEDALRVVESLRAATLRLHTASPEELERRRRATGERAAREFARMLGARPERRPTSLPTLPVAPVLKELFAQLRGTPTALATLVVRHGRACATIATPGRLWGSAVRGDSWTTGDVDDNSPRPDNPPARRGAEEKRRWSAPSPARIPRDLLPDSPDDVPRRTAAIEGVFARLFVLLRQTGARRVGLSAPSLLATAPVEALWEEARAAAGGDTVEFFVLPSLRFALDLARQPRKRVARPARLLVVGYAGHDLPGVEREVATLAKTWAGRVTVMEGSALTKREVLRELGGDYAFIHFACHGTFDALEPLRSALLLGPDSDSDATRITAEDLLDKRFRQNPIVTLGACSSALASYDGFNDLVGLPGNLFRMGARGIVGARWPVVDDAAEALVTGLYRRLEAGAPSTLGALAEVHAELRHTRPMEEWAAFGYMGLP